jgi:hypothetical protein
LSFPVSLVSAANAFYSRWRAAAALERYHAAEKPD